MVCWQDFLEQDARSVLFPRLAESQVKVPMCDAPDASWLDELSNRPSTRPLDAMRVRDWKQWRPQIAHRDDPTPTKARGAYSTVRQATFRREPIWTTLVALDRPRTGFSSCKCSLTVEGFLLSRFSQAANICLNNEQAWQHAMSLVFGGIKIHCMTFYVFGGITP